MTYPRSRKPFRSVEEWKSALMTLPDSNFFELLRSVFGNIKTPFNKQKLLEDLFVLLSRDEIRETISAYIDEQDRRLIAAVALLDEPVMEELDDFFAGETGYAELRALILNLEERLILYRFRDENVRGERFLRLALNPVLEPVIAPHAADALLLFPSFSAEGQKQTVKTGPAVKTARGNHPSVCIPEDRTLAALFVYIGSQEELFKAEGGLRKKILEDGKRFFPGLDLEQTLGILVRLGLFLKEDESESRKLIPCGERIAEYSGLSKPEREVYWTAGLYLYPNEADDTEDALLFHFSRNRLRGIAAFIHHYILLLDRKKLYPVITLRRLWKLLEKEYEGTDIWNSRSPLPFEPFLAALETAGLLQKPAGPQEGSHGSSEKPGGCFEVHNGPGTGGEGQTEQPVIVMDTAFSFILYPEISLADTLALGMFCSLKDPAASVSPEGSVICFELTRESAVRAFDRGMDSTAMIDLLNRLSHNRIDDNLAWTLKDWESRYNEVTLHEGIVLTLTEDLRYLAKAEPVASLVRRILAPGVYLLSSGEKSEAVRALKKAGVEIIAQPPSGTVRPGTERSGFFRNSFPPLDSSGTGRSLPAFSVLLSGGESAGEKPAQQGKGKTGSSGSIRQKFHQYLETMRLTKPERDELTARIERRLVLSTAQLEGTSLRYEKLEAKGLDYTGKSLIAKQAIASGSMLEVSWPGPGGEINMALGIPSALEKEEEKTVLVLEPIRVPGDTIRIPLGKISLLRRIKQSIFNS